MNDLLSDCSTQLRDAIHFLQTMVQMESPSFDKPLVDDLVRFIAKRFAEIGGEIEFARAEHAGDHLIVRFAGKTSKRVLLLGHTDTVWPKGELKQRPFKIDSGRAFGPGVVDMKAGILLMWMALGSLRKRGLENSATVLLTSDEEIGSQSSRALIEQEAKMCEAALVLEPALPGGALKTARKGVGRFTVKAIGKAAHVGIAPRNGINAIEEIARQILKIHKMTDSASGTTVTVGVVQGGTRSNVVPAEAVVEVDARVTSMQEAERILKTIMELSPELPGARLEIRGAISRPPMERSPATRRLFDLARKIGAQLGIDLHEESTDEASDGNFTTALSVPTLDGLGAIGGGAHAVDEWVDVEALPKRAALLAGLVNAI